MAKAMTPLRLSMQQQHLLEAMVDSPPRINMSHDYAKVISEEVSDPRTKFCECSLALHSQDRIGSILTFTKAHNLLETVSSVN